MGTVSVVVVTGFLGAGKTTLLRAWLCRFRRDSVAVIVNELGAVGVDAELLSERAAALSEITGGCACCTTQGALVEALGRFVDDGFERIFIETSGAASPAGIVRAVVRNDACELAGVVTVVDPSRASKLEGFAGELAAEQLGYADVVVISHGGDETLAARIGRSHPTALVVAAERGMLREGSLDDLLARRTELPRDLPAQTHAGPIESLSLQCEGDVDEARFGEWVETELARYEGRLLRVKGVLAVDGIAHRLILQGVADRLEVGFGAPFAADEARCGRLVLIGYGLDRAPLERSFALTCTRR